MMLKRAVFAPIPRASVTSATNTKVGCRRRVRNAYRKEVSQSAMRRLSS